jgi:hypothetical protein
MTTNYETPMENTFQLLGENPYTLEESIRKTVQWLQANQGPDNSAAGGF